jgi:hypothetical protein
VTPILAVVVLSGLLTLPLPAQPATALATAREVERIAATRSFWPGFDPLAIPLAIYDGKSTWLFGHPNPPSDFQPSSISSIKSHVREGRHPAVTANSSADIGGIPTATLLVDGARSADSARKLAATAIHEAFHVFQRKRHPDWQANEGDLFVYPVDDASLLALRRLESEALREALAAATPARAACLGRLTIDYRTKRFAAMDSAFSAYERGTELNEGLATYVELSALGRTTVEIPTGEFTAVEVRLRGYTIGAGIAFLLDGIRPQWQHSLEAHDRQWLDEILAGALVGAAESPPEGCALPEARVAQIIDMARRDAGAVATSRVGRRKAFESARGWRVTVIVFAGQPLRARGFDPLNIERVNGGLLHTRFLSLENNRCRMTAVDEGSVDMVALTEGLGPHPLFNGVRRAIIAGPASPVVSHDGDRVTIDTNGLQLECTGAKVDVRPNEVVITLMRP